MRPNCTAWFLVALTGPAALVEAQSAGRHPSVSVSAGPAAMIETYHSSRRSYGDSWYEGLSVGGRLAVPVSTGLAIAVQALIFRAPNGRPLEAATAGVELRLGARRQIPLMVGAGVVRQPSPSVCVEICDLDGFGQDFDPTLAGSVAYLFDAGKRVAIGPSLSVTRALASGLRYHSVHLGLQLNFGL